MAPRDALKAAAIIVLSGLLAAGLWGLYYVGTYNDDSLYLGLARSLARGAGYRDAADPSGALHDRFPIGYPLLLLPVQGHPEAARLLSLAFSLGALALAWLGLRRRLPPPAALAAVALTGLNFLWAHSATTVMSDIPFACLSLGYILAAERLLGASRGPGPMAALALLGAFCTSLRVVGALLIPATALAAWRSGRRRELAVYLAATCLLQGSLLLGPLATGYGGQAELGHRDLQGNLLYYLKAVPLTLWGDPFRLLPYLEQPDLGAVLGWIAVLGTWALLLAGAPAWGRERTDLILPWLTANLALLAVWPYLTPRFLLHLLPLLYASLARLSPLLLLPLLLGQLAADVTGLRLPAVRPPADLYAWVAAHSQPAEAVATEQHAVWLYTGRPVVTLDAGFALPHEEHWLQQLLDHRVRLVAHLGHPEDGLNRLLRRRPQLFVPQEATETWQTWRFTPPPGLPGELRSYREALGKRQAGDLVGAERLLAPLSLPGARLELALLALQRGQPEKARAEVQGVLARDPEDERARRLLESMRGIAR